MKKRTETVNKKAVLVKEREDNWRVSPSTGIPEYSADKDPHCPTGQIRKFNEEKKLKAQILAQRDKATGNFIKTTLDHSMEEISLDVDGGFGKTGKDLKSKVKTKESYAEIEILQKIVVRENLLMELQKLLKTQIDVSVCLTEVVELVKAIRFQTLDVIEDIAAWQRSLAVVVPFQYKGFNYLVKMKGDLDFLDYYPEIVEKFCFEFKSNPLAYRGGGNVISGYGYDNRGKSYGQGLLRHYYSDSDDEFLDGLEVSRLLAAEKVVQAEFDRIKREKQAGQDIAHLQQRSAGGDVLDRDIFNSLSKSGTSLPGGANQAGRLEAGEQEGPSDAPADEAGTGPQGGGKKKGKKGTKASAATINPKRAKQERIAALTEEASELKAMMVNVDEKIRFLTDHHHDLLNQRAALEAKLKEAKALGREPTAQHIAAELSVNAAVILDNTGKMKDLQRESYFINLERKRKLGTAQKLKEELEEAKRRASLQKKIAAKIKKEGLLAALQSFNTKATVEEIAQLGDKALGKRPTSASASAGLHGRSGSPPKSAGRAIRAGKDHHKVTNNGGEGARELASSASAPGLVDPNSYWTQPTRPADEGAFPALLETEDEGSEGEAAGDNALMRAVSSAPQTQAIEEEGEGTFGMGESSFPVGHSAADDPLAFNEDRLVESGSFPADGAAANKARRGYGAYGYDYDEEEDGEGIGADEYDVGAEPEEGEGDEDEEEGEEGDDEEQGEGDKDGEGGEGGGEDHEEDNGQGFVVNNDDHQNLHDARPHLALELDVASRPPAVQDATSPVRHSARSHTEYLASPSEASADGSKLSPLGYSYNSGAEMESALGTSPARNPTSSSGAGFPSHHQASAAGNDMYISDDEDGPEHDHEHEHGHHVEVSPMGHLSHEESSPFATVMTDSPAHSAMRDAKQKAISNISDLSNDSPLAFSSPGGAGGRDFFSPEAEGPQAEQAPLSRGQSAPADPTRLLFPAEAAEEDALLTHGVVTEDGAVEYPAGGAYALVKTLKLSPRPNV